MHFPSIFKPAQQEVPAERSRGRGNRGGRHENVRIGHIRDDLMRLKMSGVSIRKVPKTHLVAKLQSERQNGFEGGKCKKQTIRNGRIM